MSPATNASHLRYDPLAQFDVRERDVEYRRVANTSLLAHVYQPQGPGPFPMLIDLHGGGWGQFDRLRNKPVDQELASHGMIVASLDFRLNGQASHPAAMQDINYGIRWFKAHAAEFKARPEGIGGIGFSSGGQQILVAALRPNCPAYLDRGAGAPDADASLTYVIPCGCGYDLFESMLNPMPTDPGKYDFFRLYDYFGGIAGVKSESPQHIVESGEEIARPPVFLCQAGADVLPGFTADNAFKFAQAYSRTGGIIELAVFPGAPHIFLNPGLVEQSEAMDRGLAAIRAFISRQLAYQAAPFVK